MKAVILAGGSGSRLQPLTKVANKALLPMYNKPLIYWPIQLLVDSGIKDILIVCGGNSVGQFLDILGNGHQFGLKHLHYTKQEEPKGIADALGLAEEWANGEAICVLLSDNLFQYPIPETIKDFKENPDGARVFLTQVAHPECYGVADLNGEIVTKIVEKPKNPSSNWIVTGLYLYDSGVWDYIRSLSPSHRGELEITDINCRYLDMGKLKAHKLIGEWADAGENIDSYTNSILMAQKWAKAK